MYGSIRMPGALGPVVAATIPSGFVTMEWEMTGYPALLRCHSARREPFTARKERKYTQGSDNAQWEKRATEADESVQPKQCPKIVEHNLSSINRSVEIIVVSYVYLQQLSFNMKGSPAMRTGRRSKMVVVSVRSRSSD